MKYLLGVGLLAAVIWLDRWMSEPAAVQPDWYAIHTDGGGV